MSDVITVGQIAPLTRDEAQCLAPDEYERFAELLANLGDEEWEVATECPGWTVRQMACHVVGSAECDSTWKLLRETLRGRREQRRMDSSDLVDGINEVQIRDREGLEPSNLVARLGVAGPRVASYRRRTAALRPLPIDVPMVGKVSGATLVDIIYTRDVWMHRVDISRVTGRPMELSRPHDGRLVALMVAEWARRHGRPFRLNLSGSAGDGYTSDSTEDGELIEMDAVEFARVVSGRSAGAGLLETLVAF